MYRHSNREKPVHLEERRVRVTVVAVSWRID